MFGFIDTIVISETYFNYIKILASDKFGLSLLEVVTTLKKNPDLLETIDIDPVDKLFEIDNIRLLTVNNQKDIKEFIAKYKLLPNDAIHAACCKEYNVINIATNDSDFNRVDFLNTWSP
ncbi:MAG: PIN domain protein [Candidatus Methanofastidiosum methylothiophilum]|uniref:PIN domain protein n=1 Tax=Candidatus Methanofastidiosum methylothiophilum TaxID=1705564 RepID=A0A150J931_9EURY|nr:MAG: PIN domain protein [Candidatus Methanofastidiosum methylthiophilus]NMC76317.1 PIN domain-containing protein [Candidatus Methanofastidiosa archaeon]